MQDGKEATANGPTTVPWPPILIVLAVLAAVLLGIFVPVPWPGLDDGPARVVGIALGIAGLALVIWAITTLRQHETTVMPNERSSALVTSGPFHWVRNPIYLGDVLIFLGVAEVTKNIWFVILGLVFAVFVTWLSILPEEHHLEARFGDDYRAYKAKTRRWI
jgi:protein-S-isoprenylcysteine O-methyltransferase Ste14